MRKINNIKHAKVVAEYNKYIIIYNYYLQEYIKFKQAIKGICPFTDVIAHSATSHIKNELLLNVNYYSSKLKDIKGYIKNINKSYNNEQLI